MAAGASQLGTVIQSYLKRSEADIRRLNALGARVRLVKGAYKEPKDVAYQKKSEVDAAFVELMRCCWTKAPTRRSRRTIRR